jgi:hypothetical protein
MNLTGPRHDALRIKHFFSDRLGFNAVTLLDEEATRNRIFHTLNTHLLENTKISRGDPVMIYFAGHGAVYPAHRFSNWDEGYVEAILPVDRGQTKDGEMVPDINDFELKKFFKQLNKKRTGNITVILDCAFSGGATRHLDKSKSLEGARSAVPLLDIPDIIKKSYLSERKLILQSKEDTSTHVILAACQDHQYAWEYRDEGAFTSLLLRVFNRLPLSSTSYAQLEDSFRGQLARQEPVVYGFKKNSLILPSGGTRFLQETQSVYWVDNE